MVDFCKSCKDMFGNVLSKVVPIFMSTTAIKHVLRIIICCVVTVDWCNGSGQHF